MEVSVFNDKHVLFEINYEHIPRFSHNVELRFRYTLGPTYLEQSGLREWSTDSYFAGGGTYAISSVAVLNTVDDPIYQSERVGIFSYSIPVPVGTYEINIHLAELYV